MQKVYAVSSPSVSRKNKSAQTRQHSARPASASTHEPRKGWSIGAILGALASVAAIVATAGYAAEKWHDTTAIVDMSTDVDQQKPFTLPLYIKNPSGFFDMHYPKVSCKFSALYSDGGTGLVTSNGGTLGAHTGSLIAAGETAVFYCSFPDNFTLTNNDTGKPTPLASGSMTVTVDYETWLPWWVIPQSTLPAHFTLRKTSGGWRWTKGTEIK